MNLKDKQKQLFITIASQSSKNELTCSLILIYLVLYSLTKYLN